MSGEKHPFMFLDWCVIQFYHRKRMLLPLLISMSKNISKKDKGLSVVAALGTSPLRRWFSVRMVTCSAQTASEVMRGRRRTVRERQAWTA